MNRSRENLSVTISADWHSPIISATIYLRVARRGSIIADVIRLSESSIKFSDVARAKLTDYESLNTTHFIFCTCSWLQ